MASVNKVILIGNLGNDPDVRTTQSGTPVANLSIATNEVFKDASGERQERTEWHRVVAFGRTAENCGKYLSKGRSVYVEGRLQTRKWTDQNGQDRYSTEIVANQITFLGGRGEGGMGGGGMSASASAGGSMSADDEDLPF